LKNNEASKKPSKLRDSGQVLVKSVQFCDSERGERLNQPYAKSSDIIQFSINTQKHALCQGGQTTAADQFIQARQISCTFFSSTTFPTFDSSATALAAACHVNRTVSGPPCSGQAVANSALGLKSLATPALCDFRSTYIVTFDFLTPMKFVKL